MNIAALIILTILNLLLCGAVIRKDFTDAHYKAVRIFAIVSVFVVVFLLLASLKTSGLFPAQSVILLIQYTLIFASILILVALGGCFSEHSGVINLGLEGIMVIGSLGGALAMKFLPLSIPALPFVLLVILSAVIFGVAYSSLLAVASINFKADQTIVGTALNMLGTAGATVAVKAMNTAANPNDVSSIIKYFDPKRKFLVNIGSFEFNWFMLITLIVLVVA